MINAAPANMFFRQESFSQCQSHEVLSLAKPFGVGVRGVFAPLLGQCLFNRKPTPGPFRTPNIRLRTDSSVASFANRFRNFSAFALIRACLAVVPRLRDEDDLRAQFELRRSRSG